MTIFSTDRVVSTTHENITLLLVLYKLQLHKTALNCFVVLLFYVIHKMNVEPTHRKHFINEALEKACRTFYWHIKNNFNIGKEYVIIVFKFTCGKQKLKNNMKI